jgi:hypothetical protein
MLVKKFLESSPELKIERNGKEKIKNNPDIFIFLVIEGGWGHFKKFINRFARF